MLSLKPLLSYFIMKASEVQAAERIAAQHPSLPGRLRQYTRCRALRHKRQANPSVTCADQKLCAVRTDQQGI